MSQPILRIGQNTFDHSLRQAHADPQRRSQLQLHAATGRHWHQAMPHLALHLPQAGLVDGAAFILQLAEQPTQAAARHLNAAPPCGQAGGLFIDPTGQHPALAYFRSAGQGPQWLPRLAVVGPCGVMALSTGGVQVTAPARNLLQGPSNAAVAVALVAGHPALAARLQQRLQRDGVRQVQFAKQGVSAELEDAIAQADLVFACASHADSGMNTGQAMRSRCQEQLRPLVELLPQHDGSVLLRLLLPDEPPSPHAALFADDDEWPAQPCRWPTGPAAAADPTPTPVPANLATIAADLASNLGLDWWAGRGPACRELVLRQGPQGQVALHDLSGWRAPLQGAHHD